MSTFRQQFAKLALLRSRWASRVQAQNAGTATIRRVFVALIGGTVVLIGLALLVLPGPAVVVIPAGLAILATEFLWARRLLRKGKGFVARAGRRRGWAGLRRKIVRQPPLKPDNSAPPL